MEIWTNSIVNNITTCTEPFVINYIYCGARAVGSLIAPLLQVQPVVIEHQMNEPQYIGVDCDNTRKIWIFASNNCY